MDKGAILELLNDYSALEKGAYDDFHFESIPKFDLFLPLQIGRNGLRRPRNIVFCSKLQHIIR